MATSSAPNNPTWSSNLGFLLAAIGSAVGLGNIWKFPYITGVSGGAAFVFVYLVAVFGVVVPILVAELMLGRMGRGSPPVAMARVARQAGLSPRWAGLGWLGMLIGFAVCSCYSVVGGWTLAYIPVALSGFGGAGVADSQATFAALLASPARLLFWSAVTLALSLLIVVNGLNAGIERAVRILMPSLFAMLLLMVGYAAAQGDWRAGFDFLFSVDFSRIDGTVVLAAVGQAFFSLGVAMGIMMAYGSYVPAGISLARSAVIIAAADTLIALLAGMMIFPLVFANGLDPGQGPGLVFVTLPTAFAAVPGGGVFGAIFFALLAIAAITSIISIIEPVVRFLDDRFGWRRRLSCAVFGLVVWALGLLTVFSFNVWAGFTPFDGVPALAGKTLFDLIDYFSLNVGAPISAILICLFVGWRMRPDTVAAGLGVVPGGLFRAWRFALRYVVPLALLGILISGVQ